MIIPMEITWNVFLHVVDDGVGGSARRRVRCDDRDHILKPNQSIPIHSGSGEVREVREVRGGRGGGGGGGGRAEPTSLKLTGSDPVRKKMRFLQRSVSHLVWSQAYFSKSLVSLPPGRKAWVPKNWNKNWATPTNQREKKTKQGQKKHKRY